MLKADNQSASWCPKLQQMTAWPGLARMLYTCSYTHMATVSVKELKYTGGTTGSASDQQSTNE